MVYERGAGIMKELILKLARIADGEDFARKGTWFQLGCAAAAFGISVCSWRMSMIGHLLLMLCITLSALLVATLHQRRANPAYFEISRLTAAEKWKVYLAVTVLDIRWILLALTAHMLIFCGWSPLLLPTWLIHLAFAVALGFALGRVIPNFHLGLVLTLLYYLMMIMNSMGDPIQQLELFRYFAPYLQLMDMGRFHVSSLYLCISGLALVFLILMAQAGRKGRRAVLLALATLTAVLPVCCEVYGNRQRVEYLEMTVEGQQVWYDKRLSAGDVRYLSQMAVSLKKASERYGFPINQGDFRFYKTYPTVGNLFPEMAAWNAKKETFYFNVFSGLQLSRNPEFVEKVCRQYISKMLARSGLTNQNWSAMQMKAAVEGRVMEYAARQGRLPIEDYVYSPHDVYTSFSCYLLDHEPERFREIFDAINEARLDEDGALEVIKTSYPEIYRDFRVWSGGGE